MVKAATNKPVQPIREDVDTLDLITGAETTEEVTTWPKSGENRGALRYADAATQRAFLDRRMAEKRTAARKNREDKLSVAALSDNGYALRYAPAEIQADREFVLPAVIQHGAALEYASAALQNDEEIVRAALRQAPYKPPVTQQVKVNDDKGVFQGKMITEVIETWQADGTAWNEMPGSSRKAGASSVY